MQVIVLHGYIFVPIICTTNPNVTIMAEQENLLNTKVTNWLMRQGVAIVLLLIFTAGGFMHYKTVTARMEQDIKDAQIAIQVLNNKLIDCERSKLDMLKDLKIANLK